MTSVHFKVAAGTVALALIGGSAIAQQVQEIEVTAFRHVTTKPAGQTTSSGIPITDLSLDYHVSLEGLDLTKTSDFDAAVKRVNLAADRACKEIDRQFPNSAPSNKECAEAASDKALVKLHQMVAAAEKARN